MTHLFPPLEIETDSLTQTPGHYPRYQALAEKSLPPLQHCLDRWLTPQDTPQKELIDAARYAVFSGGKRVRPLLLFATIDHYQLSSAQAPTPLAIEVAACIELIHSYSLIHDDLPSMDDDDYRRGKKTLHTIIGEGLAILVGDFLLTLAFEKLSTLKLANAPLQLKLIETIARASGHQGMVGGQYLDITAHKHPHTKELLTWIHRKKTGALFTASILSGALIQECAQDQLVAWEKIGQDMGLLFQLIDDLIDSLPSTLTQRIPLGPSSFIAMSGSEETWKEALALREQIKKELNALKALPSAHAVTTEPTCALLDIVDLICHRYEPSSTE